MKKIIPLLFCTCLILACNNNSEQKGSGGTTNSGKQSTDGNNQITFKVDGEQVITDGWNVQRFVWDSETPDVWLNITTNMHKDKRTINVNLSGGTTGKYVFTNESMLKNSQGTYSPDFSDYKNIFSFESGEFNITELDTARNILSGTFFGVVKKDDQTMNISDGKLMSVKLKPGIINFNDAMDEMMDKKNN